MININKYNEYIKNDIDKIIKENRVEIKNKYINELYNKIVFSNEITIKYKVGEEDDLRIFGDVFVKNNKNNCKIIYNNMIIELNPFFNIKNEKFENKIIELKLRIIKEFTNMSFMFCECSSLLDLPDISKFNTSNVTDIRFIFYNCTSLESLPDISKLNTSNIKIMECIFKDCSSLKSLPDISEWNTSNVTDITGIFNNCSSLKSLPDISKWDTKNVKYMYAIFKNCSSLKSLPDISKWDTKNVEYMNAMFEDCSSLKSLPDISKWNISNLTGISGIFNNCSSLESLPDVSVWYSKFAQNMKKVVVKPPNFVSLKPSIFEKMHLELIDCPVQDQDINCPVQNPNILRMIKKEKKLIEGKILQNFDFTHMVGRLYCKAREFIESKKIKKLKLDEDEVSESEYKLVSLFKSDKLKELLKQNIKMSENFPINKLLENSESLSKGIFYHISKLNLENEISLKNIEINILLDCSGTITDMEKYFVMIQICALTRVFQSLDIPYLISVVGDSGFKVVLKELDEEHSIENLQKVLDCIFIRRHYTNVASCIKTAIDKFKTLNKNSHRVFLMFTNGLDEEFTLYEQWKNSIFVNKNHSFIFILSKNNKNHEEINEYFTKIFDKFTSYCKSNGLKVEIFKMNYYEFNEEKIGNYVKTLFNIFKSSQNEDSINTINKTEKVSYEIEQKIILNDTLIKLGKIIFNNNNSFSELNEEIYIKKIKLPIEQDNIPELKENEFEEMRKNIGSIIKLKIPIKDEEKSDVINFMKVFKIKKENIINLSSLEMLFKPKLKDKFLNYRVTVIIDSSASCFGPLCSQHTWNTIQILFSALGEIDLPCFNLIVTGKPNPYIICSEKNTLEILSKESEIWPILFYLCTKNLKNTDLASSIRIALNLHNLRKSKSPEFLYIITDGLFSLSERKRIIKNINKCKNEGINAIGIGVGISPFGIEKLFPNVIYSINPYKLIQGITSWQFWDPKSKIFDFSYIPLPRIHFNDNDVMDAQKNTIYKELKNELINIPFIREVYVFS